MKRFLKSGVADEHARVGVLLNEVLGAALGVDWGSQAVRRAPSPLPPIAVATPRLPLVERLIAKQVEDAAENDFDPTVQEDDPQGLDAEFWQAYNALDRACLFDQTVAHLLGVGRPVTIGDLADALPPEHQLETLTYWLAMARQAGVEVGDEVEVIDLQDHHQAWTRFRVPRVELSPERVEDLSPGDLERATSSTDKSSGSRARLRPQEQTAKRRGASARKRPSRRKPRGDRPTNRPRATRPHAPRRRCVKPINRCSSTGMSKPHASRKSTAAR